MVLVDTSVWIALYRKRSPAVADRLWMLAVGNDAAVTGQIWVEFLGGFRKVPVRDTFRKNLSAYPFLETTRQAYGIAVELLAKHPRLGAGDAIIAATAINTGAALFTLDADFAGLEADGLVLLDDAIHA